MLPSWKSLKVSLERLVKADMKKKKEKLAKAAVKTI